MKGREDFSSRTFGGSATFTITPEEDFRECWNKAQMMVMSQVLKRMNESLGTSETKKQQEEIDKELGW